MNSTKKYTQQRIIKNYIFFLSLFLGTSFKLDAQSAISGKIILAGDNKPAAFASVKLMNHDNGVVSDSSGNFYVSVHNVTAADSVLISLVGYEPLKMPARKALTQHAFTLERSQKTMESVVVRSFKNEEVAGAKSELVGYYRSWNTNNTGGEIGRTFINEHKEYQVAKVRFKVFNTYDTCVIRLHIREVTNGQPGREILTDSVAQIIKKSPLGDKPYEFDLNKYNVILSQKNIFVSFEVLEGTRSDNTNRSLSFVGTEEGKYFYKSEGYDSWHAAEDYTIYMKLLLRYDD